MCEYHSVLWGKEYALKIESTDGIAQDTYYLLIFNDAHFSVKVRNATERLSQSILVGVFFVNQLMRVSSIALYSNMWMIWQTAMISSVTQQLADYLYIIYVILSMLIYILFN